MYEPIWLPALNCPNVHAKLNNPVPVGIGETEAVDELVSNRRAKLKLSTAKFNAATIGLNAENLKKAILKSQTIQILKI